MSELPAPSEDKVQPSGLDALIEAAARDVRREPGLFRILLDAILYVHAPANDKAERVGNGVSRVRLMMFKSPDDGTLVIPVFTDEGKARWASRGAARVIPVAGRDLFEATRGATLMINPNDARCTLYPEEISALLADGTLAPVQKVTVDEGQAQIFKLAEMPTGLVKALRKALVAVSSVELAYLTSVKWQSTERSDGVMIALGSPPGREDREARAVAVALHGAMERLKRPVDITHFDVPGPAPDWVAGLRLKPVYRRRSAASVSSPYN